MDMPRTSQPVILPNPSSRRNGLRRGSFVSGMGPAERPAATVESVLLLEDDEFDAAITQGLIQKFSVAPPRVSRARLLQQALDLMARNSFDVVIVDMNVPDSRGLDTVRDVVRADAEAPMVVLTGDDDIQVGLQALSLGAHEYLPKSQLDKSSLERVIEYAVLRRRTLSALTQKAHFDALTGVANRSLLYDRWERSLARAGRAGRAIGVLVLDIDQFKAVNDAHGHGFGDQVLCAICDMLSANVRKNDVVARLGGDEFVLVLENLRNDDDLNTVRTKLTQSLPLAVSSGAAHALVTASIGCALACPAEDSDLMEVIRRADIDMYTQKQAAALAAGHA